LHLRLLSLNCLGVPFLPGTRARLATLGRDLDASDLDIICLQEIQFAGFVPLLRARLPGFPHVAHVPFLHAPKGGLMTFSRRPLAGREFTLYRTSGHVYTPAVADWLLRKGVLATRLTVGDTPVVVLNTHLLANYSGDWSPYNRFARQQQQQLAQLEEVVNAIEPEALLLLAGDFNVPRGSWLYDAFVHGTRLQDLMADSAAPTYRRAFLMPGRYAQAIDFVFARPPAGRRLRASARLVYEDQVELVNGWTSYISDHYGIRAELELDDL
jgi:endonuclease/exonuclease/phosphatase family metal-dependent hydrolase